MHRLTDLGTVITYAAHETSHEGFDDTDVDDAFAGFDQLNRPAPRPA